MFREKSSMLLGNVLPLMHGIDVPIAGSYTLDQLPSSCEQSTERSTERSFPWLVLKSVPKTFVTNMHLIEHNNNEKLRK